jgi:hypothetical protein
VGVEPTVADLQSGCNLHNSAEKCKFCKKCSTFGSTDSDLASIMAVWPSLAEPVRTAILALLRISKG